MSDRKFTPEQCLLEAIAEFLRGYQVTDGVGGNFTTAWNDGISTAISQMFDAEDNGPLLEAIAVYARAALAKAEAPNE